MYSKSFKFTGIVLTILSCCLSASAKLNDAKYDSLRFEIGQLLNHCKELAETRSVITIDSALALLDSAAVLVEGNFGDQDTLLAMIYQRMAVCHHYDGNYDRSATVVTEAIRIWSEAQGDNQIQVAKGLGVLVEGALYKHDLVKCEQSSDRRFEILNGLGERLSALETEQVVEALNDNGRLRVLQNRFDEAFADFNRGLDLITDEMEEGKRLRAALTGNIGWLFSFQKKYAEAERYISKALELTRVAYHPKHRLVVTSYDFLSNLARQQGNFERANQLVDSALLLSREIYGSSHPNLSGVYQAKARLLMALDSAEPALEYAQLAVEVNREATDYPTNLFMGSMATLGNAALVSGQMDLADSIFSELLTARRSFLRSVFGYASESQKLAYLERYPPIIFNLLSGAVAHPSSNLRRLALDMVLNGKGLVIDALASEQAAALCSVDPIIDSLLLEHKNRCSKIARLALSKQSGESDVLRKLADLYTEKNRFEIELSQLCSKLDFGQTDDSVSAVAVASSLPERSVLWEFVKYKRIDFREMYKSNNSLGDYYLAITLTPENEISIIDLGNASQIDNLIEAYNFEMADALKERFSEQGAKSMEKFSEVSTNLYKLLIAPLESSLDVADQLYISADGVINLLPFETLTRNGERFLIEDYRFVYLASGRDLLREETQSELGNAVVMANPDYLTDPAPMPALASLEPAAMFASRGASITPECLGSMFSPLPMTREEGTTVTQLLRQEGQRSVSYFEGNEAREDILKTLQQAPSVLHIATHGYFCRSSTRSPMSNPLLRSGLLLAGANRTIGQLDEEREETEDGILTALEASGLNLVGTDLVVLSACQTGIGDVQNGEGVFGLRRSFQHAGAQSLIMSMFAVPDETTSSLMKRFYTNWLSGKSKLTALRTASLSIIADRRRNGQSTHPLYWGGFILVGNTD